MGVLPFAQGDFSGLLEWPREHIHQHGSQYSAAELVERATGEPLNSRAFLEHISTHAQKVYGV